MALADSVPGVSGGTIAFLLGFYDTFIESLNDLMGRDNGRRKAAFLFLVKLGVGWVIGFCMSVLILSSLFDPSGGEGISVSVEHLSLGLVVYVFFTAMIAITAMVLPGISGSTLLLIFGLYVPIIGAVKEFLHMNMDYFPILMVFGLGVVTGIVGIIKIIKMCLERYRSQTIYTIIGLMTGSLYAITMGPTTLDVPRAPMSPSTFSILFFLLGGVILAGLELLKARLD